MSISLTVSAQEQSQQPQTPPQGERKPPDSSVKPERWNLFYQATSIGDEHGTFHAPYGGPLSLADYPEHDVSLTSTLFFSVRLEQNTVFVFNPEIAVGKGFSGVDGIANPPNGEIPRVASATPKPYIARLFIQHDFGFGSEKEHVESDANQLSL
jgi:high affinity Mn2+ porin